jgi:Fe-Mn family superoxide dismutase
VAIELPPLPYDYAALEPTIDEATMKLHHDKHHQAYITKLNGAIEKHPELGTKDPEELLRNLDAVPADVRGVVRNNGGGHVNHTMFWQIMKPGGGGEPTGKIGEQIKKDFGSFEDFKTKFNEAGVNQFGSGWAWLVSEDGKLKIENTSNAESPMAKGVNCLLAVDVWEHAYYLDYQNARPKYLESVLGNILNWEYAAENLAKEDQAVRAAAE